MNPIRSRIMRGEEVILDGVDVWLNETAGPTLTARDGHFDLDRPLSELMSGNFRLVLADGRSCECFVTNMSTGVHSDSGIDFQITGSLE